MKQIFFDDIYSERQAVREDSFTGERINVTLRSENDKVFCEMPVVRKFMKSSPGYPVEYKTREITKSEFDNGNYRYWFGGDNE
jgi:hypothetical protein